MTEITIDGPPAKTPQKDTPQGNKPKDRTTTGPGTALAAGTLIGVAVEAGSALNIAKELRNPIDSRNSVLTGKHCMADAEIDELYTAYGKGDPDVNYWYVDPTLRGRLEDEAPRVLTVDGIAVPRHYGTFDQEFAWLLMPVRPNRLQPKRKQVFAIAADNNYEDFTQNNSLIKKLKELQYRQDRQGFLNKVEREDIVSISAVALGAVTAVGAGIYNRVTADRNDEKDGSPKPARTFPRRPILTAALGLLGLGAINKATKILGRQVGGLVNDTTDEGRRDIYQTISTMLDGMPDDDWVDGRTALLIAKHIDGMNFLTKNGSITEKEKGAVVLGSGHIGKSELYLHDKDARDGAILKYATHVLALAGKLADEQFHFVGEQREVFMKGILDNFESFHVVSVTDPETKPKGKPFDWYVRENVNIPYPNEVSGQVSSAIKSLRTVSGPSWQAKK